jgi:hypothetical protein
MNLSDNPNIGQLKAIIARCDDDTASHILYVDKAGNVGIEALSDDDYPAGFDRRTEDWVQFRLESFHQGGGYVGDDAAEDDMWMGRVYRAFIKNWREGNLGCIDDF